MIQIYLSKIDPTLDQQKVDDLLQLISTENREKCRRFRLKEDALRTLYGELMVRYFLWKQFSFKAEDIELLKYENEKPYVKDFPIHFNISHAGDYVVCAFCEQEVGIDIERIRDIDLKIGKRFFCRSEYKDLLAQKPADQLDYFYSLWTLKESYIKWLGTGLSTPLDSFCFNVVDTQITFVDYNRETVPFFKQYSVEGYKLSVCSMVDDFPAQIERFDVEEMILDEV